MSNVQRIQNKQTLSKVQSDFNRMLDRIQRAQERKAMVELQWNDALELTKKAVIPAYTEWCLSKWKELQLLDEVRHSGLFSTVRQREMREWMQSEIRLLSWIPDDLSLTGMKEYVNELTKKMALEENESREHDPKREASFNRWLKDLQQQLNEANVEISLEGLHHGMSDEELKSIIGRRLGEHYQGQNSRRSEKKQAKKERKKALQKRTELPDLKDLQDTYKHLVKLIHPDLERDEQKKAIREEQMKKLTVAYENRDLLTILDMEMELMGESSFHWNDVEDERLRNYVKLLQRKATELEEEIREIPLQMKYFPLTHTLNIQVPPDAQIIENARAAWSLATRKVERWIEECSKSEERLKWAVKSILTESKNK